MQLCHHFCSGVKKEQYLLSDSPEVGQEVLGDNRDELFGRIIQQVTLQHIQQSMQSSHAAGQVGAAKGRLQQAAHRLCYCFVLGVCGVRVRIQWRKIRTEL